MSYIPKTYWANRVLPNSKELPEFAEQYISKHIKDAETILDYGVGQGRLLHLYKDKVVTGFDIVERYRDVCRETAIKNGIEFRWTDELYGAYDVIVCSKVLLHVLPENIESVMNELSERADKVIVYDTVGDCNAHHNFKHDFESIVDVKDVVIKDKELLFWYS